LIDGLHAEGAALQLVDRRLPIRHDLHINSLLIGVECRTLSSASIVSWNDSRRLTGWGWM